jgi:hypothetical protein
MKKGKTGKRFAMAAGGDDRRFVFDEKGRPPEQQDPIPQMQPGHEGAAGCNERGLAFFKKTIWTERLPITPGRYGSTRLLWRRTGTAVLLTGPGNDSMAFLPARICGGLSVLSITGHKKELSGRYKNC